jgi:hypothetical protein
MAVTTCSSSFNSSNRNIFFLPPVMFIICFPFDYGMSSKAPEVSLLEMKISPYYGFGEGITI